MAILGLALVRGPDQTYSLKCVEQKTKIKHYHRYKVSQLNQDVIRQGWKLACSHFRGTTRVLSEAPGHGAPGCLERVQAGVVLCCIAACGCSVHIAVVECREFSLIRISIIWKEVGHTFMNVLKWILSLPFLVDSSSH